MFTIVLKQASIVDSRGSQVADESNTIKVRLMRHAIAYVPGDQKTKKSV